MKQLSVLFLLLASVLPAQQPDPAFLPWLGSGAPATRGDLGPAVHPRAPSVLLNRTAGLQMLDGELWGGADGYKVRFDADGFEFTPALGRSAPRNYPLSFRMESCGRGAELLPAAVGKRSHQDLRVEYDRGTVTERYDLGTEAMEQSFVFRSRPQGRGDLIVRGRLQTDMVVTAENGGLRFEQPGVGGFHLGAVTGIDRNGLRATGAVRCEHGIVELSLPAEFVDRAAFPLVLDPPIGATFVVTPSTPPNDRLPAAAFDVANDCYLVVWTNSISSSDADINGQRISRAGSLLGNRLLIDTSTAIEAEPTIANVRGRSTFVVAYTRNGDISARGVAAVNGAVGLLITVAGGTSNQHSPSIGGDTVLSVAGNSVCVWESDAEPGIMARRVTVNVDGTLSASATVHTLVTGSAGRPSRPRISKGGGSTVRFAIVFERLFADKDPWAIVVSASGMPLTLPIPLDSSTGIGTRPEVDGDGTNWVAAWEHDVNFSPTDLRACSFGLVGSSLGLVASPFVIVESGTLPRRTPAVIRTAASTLVAFNDQTSPFGMPQQTDTVIRSVDPFHCLPCEGRFPLTGGVLDVTPAGCSTLSGGGPPDDALVVWCISTNTNGDIAGTLWRSVDGTVSSIQGGCGLGGLAFATCARVGNPDFTHRLRGSSPLAISVLIQSLSQSSVTCNNCTLAPSLSGSVWSLFVTDAVGNVAFPSAIPNNAALTGFQLFEQWLTLRAGGACSAFDVDLSNAVRIIIE